GPLIAVEYQVPDHVLTAVLAPLLPAAFMIAVIMTGRARRGDVPDWRWPLVLTPRSIERQPRRGADFASAARAPVWVEVRRHGRSLPIMVGILLPFALLLLFFFDPEMTNGILSVLAGVLLLPPFMAGFAASTVSKSHPQVKDYYGISAFAATRPLTSSAMVAAKLKMAVWSTLAAWLLVLI